MPIEAKPYSNEEIERERAIAFHDGNCNPPRCSSTTSWEHLCSRRYLATIDELRAKLRRFCGVYHPSLFLNGAARCMECGMTRAEYERELNPPELVMGSQL